jgi:hypothetical protein
MLSMEYSPMNYELVISSDLNLLRAENLSNRYIR